MATGSQAPVSTVDMVDPFGDVSGIALYKFDGDATDESGTYNGTASNVTYGTGKFGQAAVFNGSSSYIATSFTLPAISTYTFSVWFKTSVTGKNNTIFGDYLSSGANSSGRAVIQITSENKLMVNMGNGIAYWYDNTSFSMLPFLDGAWHNITLVVNGTTQKVYIDSSLSHTYTSSAAAGAGGQNQYRIGRPGSYNDNYFNGSIDQFRIFNRALTAEEVAMLYEEREDLTLGKDTQHLIDPFGDKSGVSLYEFNGDLVDKGGIYNGSVVGSAEYQTGVFQSSVKNSTVNDYIQFPNLGGWFASRSAYSFSIWAKVPEQATGSAKIFHVCSPTLSPPYYVFALNMTSSNVATWNSISGGGAAIVYSNTMALDTFYHLCVTFNSGVQKLYVDGVYVGTHTGATITDSTHGTAMIGRIPTQNTLSNSNIVTTDQMRIFNRALTATEVTALYNEESYQVATIPTDGLIASWELDTDATDSAGTYNGTSYNVTYNGNNASFNGSNSYIQVGNNLSAFRTPVHSYGCWVKFNSTSNDPFIINNNVKASGPGSNYNTGTCLQTVYNKISAVHYFLNTETLTDSNGNKNTSYAALAQSSEVVSLNVWYHVFLVMNTNNVKLYINGVLDSEVSSVQSTNYAAPQFQSENNYSLGAYNNYPTQHYPLNGYIDKAKHYNRVLTATEISNIYNAEKGQ